MIVMLYALFLGWLFVPEAVAAPLVDQTFQVFHATNFEDDGGGDDYFVTNGDYLARHAFVALYTPGPTFVASGFTDGDGLITFENIDKALEHKLWLYGWHDHNNSGRDLVIVDDVGFPLSVKSDAFYPTSTLFTTTTINLSYDAAIEGQEWINVAAAASWTIRRRPTAFPTESDNGAQYTFVMDDPDNCSPTAITANAGYCSSEETVYIDPEEDIFKSTVAHELGHELQHWALVPDDTEDAQDWMYASDYGASADSDCTGGEGHSLTSKEYQMAAIVEGMAHYVAAVAFNQTQEDDCRLTPSSQILWDSGFGTQALEYSCEGYDPNTGNPLGTDDGGVEWYGYDVPAGAYFDWDSPNTAHDACSAAGDADNRATELDWLRFFWDLDNKTALSLEDIIEAWVLAMPSGDQTVSPADPPRWNENDNLDSGSSSDNARLRLEVAFGDLGWGEEWDDFAIDNGVMQ